MTVEAGGEIRFSKTVHDFGDIPDPQTPTVLGADRDLRELGAGVGLSLASQKNFAGSGLDGTAGEILRVGSHRADHLVEGQVIALKGHLGDLDADLIRP